MLSDEVIISRITEDVALIIADEIDKWNSTHDADNQADSDWIRERYANKGSGG